MPNLSLVTSNMERKPHDPREQDVASALEAHNRDRREAVSAMTETLRASLGQSIAKASRCAGLTCGQPVRAHFDASGSIFLGCAHAAKVQTDPSLLWPVNPLVYNDPHASVTAAIQRAILTECGPAMTVFVSTLTGDDLLMICRELSRVSVSAHLAEQAK